MDAAVEAPKKDPMRRLVAHHHGLIKGLARGMDRQDAKTALIEADLSAVRLRLDSQEKLTQMVVDGLDRLSATGDRWQVAISEWSKVAGALSRDMDAIRRDHAEDMRKARETDLAILEALQADRSKWPRIAIGAMFALAVGACGLAAALWPDLKSEIAAIHRAAEHVRLETK